MYHRQVEETEKVKLSHEHQEKRKISFWTSLSIIEEKNPEPHLAGFRNHDRRRNKAKAECLGRHMIYKIVRARTV